MSQPFLKTRPRQVLLGAGLSVVGGLLVLVSLFDSMGQLRSSTTRDGIEQLLATRSDQLTVSVDAVLTAMRAVVLLDGALAAVAVVLGGYAAFRHRGARVVLTVAAVLLVVTIPISGSLLALLVGLGAGLLWSPPARDWFAGREPRPAGAVRGPGTGPGSGERPGQGATRGSDQGARPQIPQSPVQPGDRDQPVDRDQPGNRQQPGQQPGGQLPGGQQSGGQQPRPAERPFGVAPVGPETPPAGPGPAAAPAAPGGPEQPGRHYPVAGQAGSPAWSTSGHVPGHAPGGMPGWAPAARPDAGRRPGAVTAAAWLTWVFSGLTVLISIGLAVVLVVAPDQVVEVARSRFGLPAGVSGRDLLAVLWVATALEVLWCLGTAALAVLAFRRVGWARIVLAVSAGIAAAFGLFSLPAGLLNTVAAVATVVLLTRPSTSAWYAGRRRPSYPPSQGPPTQGPPSRTPPTQGSPTQTPPPQTPPPQTPPQERPPRPPVW